VYAAATIHDDRGGPTSCVTGSERFMALLGGLPFREPTVVELLTPCLLPTGYDVSCCSTSAGKIKSMATRLTGDGSRR
jgi:hypothetical protein